MNMYFYMPWYINGNADRRGTFIGKSDYVIKSNKILTCLVIGGVVEFCGSLLVLYSFSQALEANMNQGVSNSLMSVSGVIIVVMSYILYKEHLDIAQIFGILLILASILLISLTKYEEELPAGLSLFRVL